MDLERSRTKTPGSTDEQMKLAATFSADRSYRYTLSRIWDDSRPLVLFIGLNPSTADEHRDDPTIGRCCSFAQDWGMGGIVMVNLFAWRATRPEELRLAKDPIGPENDQRVKQALTQCPLRVACWGNHGRYLGRDAAVLQQLPVPIWCLGQTKQGQPCHPLRLKRETNFQEYLRR